MIRFAALLVFCLGLVSASNSCRPDLERTNCGHFGTSQDQCAALGCCWSPLDVAQSGPWCFAQAQPSSYSVHNVSTKTGGTGLTIELQKQGAVTASDVAALRVDVWYETTTRLHVKISDAEQQRYEVPQAMLPTPPPPTSAPASLDYKFDYMKSPFTFKVTRVSDNTVVFDTSLSEFVSNLVFADQFLQIGTNVPQTASIFGLGERLAPFQLPRDNYTATMWALDNASPTNQNMYGVHPFYLDVRQGGSAHGVFLRNNNAMDVDLQQQALNFKVTGGVLDFYFFMGDAKQSYAPESVVQQYHEVIGLPHMPPYWALGWHQCRYGMKSIEVMKEVYAQYQKANIPLDTLWSDIDYMDKWFDFTWDPVNYPQAEVKDFVVNTLHATGRHYVTIVDPGIPNFGGSSYKPFTSGVDADIFIKTQQNDVAEGVVWPGSVAFPDFVNPKTEGWWQDQIAQFLDGVPVDGLWIDMNEPSNFCGGGFNPSHGSCPSPPSTAPLSQQGNRHASATLPGFSPNQPPYAINNNAGIEPTSALDKKQPLYLKTGDMSWLQYSEKSKQQNELHYNLHSLYGHSEGIATNAALESILKKRSLVISRSTFAGSGHHVGHWLGDNFSSYADMAASIQGILDMNLFGIPLVGADICGFNGATNEELCARWQALGAFYPFSRNHDAIGEPDQFPYLWPDVANVTRQTLAAKYSILPYYNTLFFQAHTQGGTVARSLMFEFPQDANTYSIDTQFLIGSGVLISPVLTEGATSVKAYFPEAAWFDFFTHAPLDLAAKGYQTLQSTIPDTPIPVHVRGGTIIPMQKPELTTTETRQNPLELLVPVANGGSQFASGSLFWDDGEQVDPTQTHTYATFVGSVSNGRASISSTVQQGDVSHALDTITILGSGDLVNIVNPSVTGCSSSTGVVTKTTNSVIISLTGCDISKPFSVSWSTG